MNERLSFLLNRKPVATGCNEGFTWNILPRDRKTASNGRDLWDIGNIVSTSQNEVRLKTAFPLDKEKLSLTEKSEK